MTQLKITDDLQALLNVLPADIRAAVEKADDSENLLEIILDLGRVPTARFVDREISLREAEVTRSEIDHVDDRTSEFDADNRAGIERTLHRISAIRNRRMHIVGLTLRVGRAVYGTVDIIQDIVEGGKSVLILGRPGVGKTTLLREAARILAENKRVVIVDTSNEIGGDGDVPHPAVGKARRMQVREPMLQHEVMIEAVENHNPEVIVIDEIGRELEAAAARTIAERGVQLIGTAHGQTLDNLLLNPTLSDLVGGIEAVTLSDEEARRRGTQKTVLERRAPQPLTCWLRSRPGIVSQCIWTSRTRWTRCCEVSRWRPRSAHGTSMARSMWSRRRRRSAPGLIRRNPPRRAGAVSRPHRPWNACQRCATSPFEPARGGLKTIRIYPYGVARNRLLQAVKRLGVPAVIVKDAAEANALVTLRTYYRDHQQAIVDAEQRGLPIYVLRSSTVGQMEQFLSDVFNLRAERGASSDMDGIREQTQEAIQAVLNGERWVDLPPGSSLIRRLEHEMARQAELDQPFVWQGTQAPRAHLPRVSAEERHSHNANGATHCRSVRRFRAQLA